jgi:hypothetical protein
MVGHTTIPTRQKESVGGLQLGQPQQKHETLPEKSLEVMGVVRVVQVVEHLPSKHKSLCANLSTAQKIL